MQIGLAVLACGLVFLAMVSVITLVHELGHFLAARAFGMRVDVFSLGFGRELASRTDRRGTRWKVCVLPLGGYVKMFGEDCCARDGPGGRRPLAGAERAVSYFHRPAHQRAGVVLAGPLANLCFAAALIAAIGLSVGRSVLSPEIGRVLPGSPAAAAGLLPGDRILAIEDRSLVDLSDVAAALAAGSGRDLHLAFDRRGSVFPAVIRPDTALRAKPSLDALGLVSLGRQRVGLDPLEAAAYGLQRTVTFTREEVVALAAVATGERSMADLAGPVRIARLAGRGVAALGVPAGLLLTALLSINVALVNLLPIPVLDGGHLVFLGLEKLRGRPLSRHIQQLSALGGLLALLALFLLVTINDVLRL